MNIGTIRVEVTTEGQALPIAGALVIVENVVTGGRYRSYTDVDGRIEPIGVEAPSPEASLTPDSEERPYSLYHVVVYAQGYTPVVVENVQVFGGIESIVPVDMTAQLGRARGNEAEVIDIPPNALESPEPREPEGPSENARILNRVYIPETITVHLGKPSSSARNVRVSFLDYIKNVASSEIYPTWPDAALRANIHAQVGFVLNRIFTEWYPSQGYDFDITNSTAYDQFFVAGRNIFDNISRIVDEIFNVYPRRQGRIDPLFSSFCNGTTATCSGLSQWGTVTLADQGYTPLGMLQYYYGSDVELAEANEIQGIERSYPGTPLRIGDVSNDVRVIQQQLNRIRQNYPAIPRISNPNGTFDDATLSAVRAFQRIFDLQVDGIVGRATWYQISYIYAAVKRLAELNSEGEWPPLGSVPYPGTLLRQGSRGENVRVLQQYLNEIAQVHREIPTIQADGIFGPKTRDAVLAFQRLFGLDADGIVGPKTWAKLVEEWGKIGQ